MSPEPLLAIEPVRASPSAARRAIRFSWCGRSGASVATTMMMRSGTGIFPLRGDMKGVALEFLVKLYEAQRRESDAARYRALMMPRWPGRYSALSATMGSVRAARAAGIAAAARPASASTLAVTASVRPSLAAMP